MRILAGAAALVIMAGVVILSIVDHVPRVTTVSITALCVVLGLMAILGWWRLSSTQSFHPAQHDEMNRLDPGVDASSPVRSAPVVQVGMKSPFGEPEQRVERRSPVSPSGTLPVALRPVHSVLPGLSAHAAMVGSVSVWAASRVGRRHLALGEPRQDAFALIPVGDGSVCAVADGLGSTSDAHAAANAAVLGTTEISWELPSTGPALTRAEEWKLSAEHLVHEVQSIMVEYLDAEESSPISPSTTLVVTVIQPESPDSAVVWWLSVGDSAVLHFSPGTKTFEFLNEAPLDSQSGTDSLPTSQPSVEAGVFSLPKGDSCIIATDGAWKQVYSDYGYFSETLQQLISRKSDASHLLAMIEAESPGFDDDATMVVMHYPGCDEAIEQ